MKDSRRTLRPITSAAFFLAATLGAASQASAGGYVLPLVENPKATGAQTTANRYLRHDSEEYRETYRDLLWKWDWLRNHPVMLQELRRK